MTNQSQKEPQPYLDWGTILPDAQAAMINLEAVSHHVGIPADLLELYTRS